MPSAVAACRAPPARLETIVIALPAIEVNGHFLRALFFLGQSKGSFAFQCATLIGFPITEREPQPLASGLGHCLQFFPETLDNQSRALCADRGKQFRISKGETKAP